MGCSWALNPETSRRVKAFTEGAKTTKPDNREAQTLIPKCPNIFKPEVAALRQALGGVLGSWESLGTVPDLGLLQNDMVLSGLGWPERQRELHPGNQATRVTAAMLSGSKTALTQIGSCRVEAKALSHSIPHAGAVSGPLSRRLSEIGLRETHDITALV